MATYVTLLKFTQQGIKDIKNGPNRLDAAKKAYKSVGADIKAYYLTMGRFDAVVVSDAAGQAVTLPNDVVFAMIGREAPLDFFRRSGIPIRGEWRK